LTRSKTDCVPQKQPPAKIAVSLPLVWASGLSPAGAGIGVLVAAVHPVQATKAITKVINVVRIEKELNIQVSRN
jgi:hypothetical protein